MGPVLSAPYKWNRPSTVDLRCSRLTRFPYTDGWLFAYEAWSRSCAGGPSYADGVEQEPLIVDSRGVDVSQIRRQLRMTVPDRVRSMVEAANTMLAIQERAQASLRRAR